MSNAKKLSAGAVTVIIVGILVAFGIFKGAPSVQAPDQNSATNLVVYKNATYNFEFSYPNDWEVVENNQIPAISIYKKTGTTSPTIALHNNVSGISIFPQGTGTEGPQGEIGYGAVALAGTTTTAFQYKLKDGSVWGQFVSLGDLVVGKKEWLQYAFIWTGLEVQNLKVSCIEGEKEVPADACDIGLDATGSIIRTGSVNTNDAKTIENILSSLRFIGN